MVTSRHMGGFIMAVARNHHARGAITDPALVETIVRRADSTSTRVERWDSEDVLLARFHGAEHDPRPTTVRVTLDHLVRQFERFTDATLRLDSPSIRITAPKVAWRTLWVCQDEHVTVVATSLRQCAFLLGGLQPDEHSPTQFLLTGTLGPERSWDHRVRQLQGGESVEIDFRDGGLRRGQPVSEGKPESSELSEPAARTELADRIRDSLTSKLADTDGWVLPLSGGHDSRGLLLMLPEPLPTITWGSAASRNDRHSDTWVAGELAAATGASNRFIEISEEMAEPELALTNFVAASEGRSDHIDAYADGLRSWRSLAADGVTGIVRGDECFGWVDRRTELGVRRSVGALGLADLIETDRTREIVDRHSLWQLPRSPDQSLAAWRDELYRSFRVPSVLAPLTEIKANFVDVVCPLLEPEVVSMATSLRDDQRTDKRVFAKLVEQLSPPVPFATRSSLQFHGFAARDDTRAMLIERLTDSPPAMFDRRLVAALTVASAALEPVQQAPSTLGAAKRLARTVLPRRAIRSLARNQMESPVSVTDDTLRLRMALADEAVAMLEEWGAAGATHLRR